MKVREVAAEKRVQAKTGGVSITVLNQSEEGSVWI